MHALVSTLQLEAGPVSALQRLLASVVAFTTDWGVEAGISAAECDVAQVLAQGTWEGGHAPAPFFDDEAPGAGDGILAAAALGRGLAESASSSTGIVAAGTAAVGHGIAEPASASTAMVATSTATVGHGIAEPSSSSTPRFAHGIGAAVGHAIAEPVSPSTARLGHGIGAAVGHAIAEPASSSTGALAHGIAEATSSVGTSAASSGIAQHCTAARVENGIAEDADYWDSDEGMGHGNLAGAAASAEADFWDSDTEGFWTGAMGHGAASASSAGEEATATVPAPLPRAELPLLQDTDVSAAKRLFPYALWVPGVLHMVSNGEKDSIVADLQSSTDSVSTVTQFVTLCFLSFCCGLRSSYQSGWEFLTTTSWNQHCPF